MLFFLLLKKQTKTPTKQTKEPDDAYTRTHVMNVHTSHTAKSVLQSVITDNEPVDKKKKSLHSLVQQ